MKYVIQKSRGMWRGEYYHTRSSLTTTPNLNQAIIYDREEQAESHPCWNEYDPQAYIIAISEAELFKAKLSNK